MPNASESNINPIPERIQVWADVGGTFTDCFVVVHRDGQPQRRRMKVLSTGVIRCPARWSEDENQFLLDLPTSQRIDRFWEGATVSRLSGEGHRIRLGTLTEYDGKSSLARLAASASPPGNRPPFPGEFLAELDLGLEAPVMGARLLLGIPPMVGLPELDVRLGTTRGTNALLTRTGAKVALLTTEGFGDVLKIGEQDRPDLFALDVQKPDPLTDHVIEVVERIDHTGKVLIPLADASLSEQLQSLQEQGIESIAICLMHGHINGEHEERVEKIAREIGFNDVSRSSRIAPLIKLVSRTETTTLDAYLNPILRQYLDRVGKQFGGSSHCKMLVMTSGGNLVSPDQYRGRDSVLSGPAGGCVALGKLADSVGQPAAIGLDMGGTSTDVSRFEGVVGRRYESRVSGVRILTPMMDIHTVAAGGGSVCDYQHGRLQVGPSSAGSDPGPACYGRGGPLTVTDANFLLGRIPVDKFPFPLNVQAARSRLANISERMSADRRPVLPDEELLEGFLEIANTNMAEAVRTVTTAQGSDPRDMALVGFGGAAGQHLCDVADRLGMTSIIDHPDSSLLSAMGMGMADIGQVRTQGIYTPLKELDLSWLEEQRHEIYEQLLDDLGWDETSEAMGLEQIQFAYETECRYLGTDSTLSIPWNPTTNQPHENTIDIIRERFEQQHIRRFGYVRQNQPVELVALRGEAKISPKFDPLKSTDCSAPFIENPVASDRLDETEKVVPSIRVWLQGQWNEIPRLDRESLVDGQELPSPCLVGGEHSSLLVQPGWNAVVTHAGVIQMRRQGKQNRTRIKSDRDDPIALEVISRRLQGIADSMGEVVRRTSSSVNVKERRDYSCAVFRADGMLVANAPHVPVHLGAMGHTIRHLKKVYPQMFPGDCFLSNDPFAGGSHLPDITVVTPVFCQSSAHRAEPLEPDFFVASRAHHAEMGGITPGSMPPFASCLAEEGVVLRDFALVRQGVESWDELKRLLSEAEYPSRNPQENLDDLQAQRAAGGDGAAALVALTEEYSTVAIQEWMGQLIELAGDHLQDWIQQLSFADSTNDGVVTFRDKLDDGSVIAVRLSKHSPSSQSPRGGKTQLRIDFTGSEDVHPHGFNATPAIVTAAVMYVLRLASGGNLPLCDGLLRDIDLVIPQGMLSPPPHEDPKQCAAVVAGNVETSQRIVDVLLGALQLAAASQGTMNNILFGDDTFGYYETIGGGSGASSNLAGADAVHCHMTNTRITDPEVFEHRLPCRLWKFSIRRGSGGLGYHRGGDGIVREMEFLKPLTVSMITGRRTSRPYGMAGGMPGEPGKNTLIRGSESLALPFATTISVQPGDRLQIDTPGGGGWGVAKESDDE